MLRDLAWSWKLRASETPWDRSREAIWDHLSAHIEPGRVGLAEGGDELPDERPISDDSRLRWAPGAEDGVLSHHMAEADAAEILDQEIRALQAVLEWPSRERLAALYNLLLKHPTLSTVDPLLERLVGDASSGRLREERLKRLAVWLVKNAPDREPVKMGLAWLGLFRDPSLRPIFFTVGRHDEFTLFAAVALGNYSGDVHRNLWELARHAQGWGRVHIVERLRGTTDPEIRSWLLREGYRNHVMYEYTAHVAATTGGLLEALTAGTPDRELRVGAGEILAALIAGQGGPAEGIEEYEDGAAATRRYVEHLEAGHGEELSHVLAVDAIQGFLTDEDADWSLRERLGWSRELRDQLLRQCEAILSRSSWSEAVRDDLESGDETAHWQASEAARVLGIDAWPAHLAAIEGGSLSFIDWARATDIGDRGRMEQVVAVAMETFDLGQLGSGPAESLGLGPNHALYSAHEQVVRGVGRFPGLGWALVRAGLRSPVVRNRHAAVGTLEAWGKDAWPPDAVDALERAIAEEPRDDVRDAMQQLL